MAESTGLEPVRRKTLTGSPFPLVVLGALFFGSKEPKRASSHVTKVTRKFAISINVGLRDLNLKVQMAEPTGLEPVRRKTLTGSPFPLVVLGALFFGSKEPKRASSHVTKVTRKFAISINVGLRDLDLKVQMAESTGLEPATSHVTGERSNQLNYDSACCVNQRGR